MKTFLLLIFSLGFALTGTVNAADKDKDKGRGKGHDRPAVPQQAVAAAKQRTPAAPHRQAPKHVAQAPRPSAPKHQEVKHAPRPPAQVAVKHNAPKRVAQAPKHVTPQRRAPEPVSAKHAPSTRTATARVPSVKPQPSAVARNHPATANAAHFHGNANVPNRSTTAASNGGWGSQNGRGRDHQTAATQVRSNPSAGRQIQNVARPSTQVRNTQSVTVRNENLRHREEDHNRWTEVRERHHGEHHDRSWWKSNYTRFSRFGGGYYFLDRGYWYPAYGYDPTYSTYISYEPIYAYNDLNPSDVIASVQTELQRLGYYDYDVDGEMGPITRRALGEYQRDSGLEITYAIDRATLRSLGLG